LVAFLLVSVTGFSQPINKKATYKTVKTIFANLNSDNIIDTIVLSSSSPETESFNRISISMSGAKKKIFYAKDAWADIYDPFLALNKNLVKSKIIFIKKTEKHTVIILSGGTDAAGYGGEFSIINIENNEIKMVFDHSDDGIDVEVPIELSELENNGRLYFVYTTLYELYEQKDKLNADIGTYHPYFVYPVDNNCKLNYALSKKYMEEHYVFAGYNYNEKIKILYPRDKRLKPTIWKNN